jgi:hypothetical protein
VRNGTRLVHLICHLSGRRTVFANREIVTGSNGIQPRTSMRKCVRRNLYGMLLFWYPVDTQKRIQGTGIHVMSIDHLINGLCPGEAGLGPEVLAVLQAFADRP